MNQVQGAASPRVRTTTMTMLKVMPLCAVALESLDPGRGDGDALPV